MNKKLLLMLMGFSIFIFSQAQSVDEKIIRKSMDDQLAAWNDGDISRFMDTYWKNDSLMFIDKNSVTYGWDKTKENYVKSYPDVTTMGKLDFDIVQIKRLSVLYFSVVGKWHLKRTAGDLSGHFTLLFKKIKDKWVIVSDHTS